MFDYIKADMVRYEKIGGWYSNLGFWITLVYRFGSWARRIKPRILGYCFLVFYALLNIPIRALYQVYLPSRVIIGPGLVLQHPFLILLPITSVIGRNCTIYHDVTFGHGAVPGAPKLANNVVVFPGARILGGVKIGEDAHIGANAVVMRDIDSGVMVMGSSTRMIPRRMAKGLLKSQVIAKKDKKGR